MTLTELHYLIAVARERHFGRAAESCHVAQPTLSVAIKKLEDEIGISLFERGKTEITVTPAGQTLVAQAQRIVEEVERFKIMADQSKDPLAGPFRLGAIFTIGPYLFPNIVTYLNKHVPQMPLLLEENYTAALSQRLKQGELDAIVVALPFDEPGIVTLPLFEEPFIVLVPQNHPWSQKDNIDSNDLAQQTLLLLGAGHCFRDQVLASCPDCNRSARDSYDIQRTVEGSSLETIRLMVASGMGITVLPATAAPHDETTRSLTTTLHFKNPAPARRMALAWRASYPRPKAIEAVRQAIRNSRLENVVYSK